MNKAALKIIKYQNIFNLIISKTFFLHLIMQIIKNLQFNFHIQFIAVKIFQFEAETYISTFLTDMIALYLSLQFIIYCSISATNFDTQHAEYVTIMNKNFIHIQYMSFFLDAFNKDSDQTFNLIISKIISHYNHDKKTSELTMT